MKPGCRPVTSYSSTYFYLIKTTDDMSEEGGCVCHVVFQEDSICYSKARGIGVRLQEGFCNRPWASKRNREILKWVTPQADTDISSKKRTLPGWDKEGMLLASKFHTSKQWKRLSGGKTAFWQQEQNQSPFRGAGIPRLPYAFPDASSPLTQHFIYMGIPPILQIFQKKRWY